MKACTKCGVVKPLTLFSKHRLSKDGHAYQCKECNEIRAKKWRITSIGVYTQLRGRQNYLRKHGDSRAKPFLLKKEEFIKWYDVPNKKCHYCGIPEGRLKLVADKYGSRWRRLTIDCKKNTGGYTMDNIVLACDKCNITKNNILSYEDMCYIGQNFIKPKWKQLIGENGGNRLS